MGGKSFEVVDQETGVTLKYSYCEAYGWCCAFPNIQQHGQELARKAMKNSKKYWPEQSEEHKKAEQEMLEVIRSIPVND